MRLYVKDHPEANGRMAKRGERGDDCEWIVSPGATEYREHRALARLVLALTENTDHYPFPKLFRKAALARCAREIEDGVDPATDRAGSRNTVAEAKESE